MCLCRPFYLICVITAIEALDKTYPYRRLKVEMTPRQAVRRIGEELEILCKFPYAIYECAIIMNGELPRRSHENNEDVVFHNQGLKNGECRAVIKNIKEKWNGTISCTLPYPITDDIESGMMRLYVAKAPGAPRLIVPCKAAFKVGDVFFAMCIVPDGRPAANITWFLGDQELHEGISEPSLSHDPITDLTTISQNVTWILIADNANKRLVCRSKHPALDKPVELTRDLLLHYPPYCQKSCRSEMTIFGLKVGSEGHLNVTVRANPPPGAEWTIDAQRLTAPQTSEDGQFKALETQLVGMGYYNITLIVSRLTEEDFNRSYHLEVTNYLGTANITVQISTMDEPADTNIPDIELVMITTFCAIGGVALIAGVVCVTIRCRRRQVLQPRPPMPLPMESLYEDISSLGEVNELIYDEPVYH